MSKEEKTYTAVGSVRGMEDRLLIYCMRVLIFLSF